MVKGGACVVKGGVAWQKGVCVARGAYVAKGRAWQGHAWQDRRPLQRTECSGMHPCIGTKATLLPDGLTGESNLMFTLSNDKDQKKNPVLRSLSFSVNEP